MLEWRMIDEEGAEDDQRPSGSVELLNELVPKSKRPTRRIGFPGMLVDTIEWCKVPEPTVLFSRLTLDVGPVRRAQHANRRHAKTYPRG